MKKYILVVCLLIVTTLLTVGMKNEKINNARKSASSVLIPILVEELADNSIAATELPVETYINKVSLPISSFDFTINRRDLLKMLFTEVTEGKLNNQAKVEAWVQYLQDRIAHPKYPPLLENGRLIYDPLWILKNRIAQCGQTNRLIVDGLSAAGFKARVVQLNNHVAAEVWLNGRWGFLDADSLNFGQFVRHEDGTLASTLDIHRNRNLLNGLRPGMEFKLYPIDVIGPTDLTYEGVFDTKPYYYIKTANQNQELNEYYGWLDYETIHE